MIKSKNKISGGLARLLADESVIHFETSPEIFLENPSYINAYINSFSEAQLIEIASH